MGKRRPRFDNDGALTDKERILMSIIQKLSFLHHFIPDCAKSGMVHFEMCHDTSPLRKNDLVLCRTSGIHRFTVGYVEEVVRYDEVRIRELDSNKVCRVSNENFIKIVNMDPNVLRSGSERKMAVKVWKALNTLRDKHYPAIYRDELEFLPNSVCRIHIKLHVFTGRREELVVDLKWNNKTTLKAIYQAALDAGVVQWATGKPSTEAAK